MPQNLCLHLVHDSKKRVQLSASGVADVQDDVGGLVQREGRHVLLRRGVRLWLGSGRRGGECLSLSFSFSLSLSLSVCFCNLNSAKECQIDPSRTLPFCFFLVSLSVSLCLSVPLLFARSNRCARCASSLFLPRSHSPPFSDQKDGFEKLSN
jgi:hypothetical protein